MVDGREMATHNTVLTLLVPDIAESRFRCSLYVFNIFTVSSDVILCPF